MSPLKKIKNWFIRQFTNPPKYKELPPCEKTNSLKGTTASGFSPDTNMLFLHGYIDERGEQQLNDTLKSYAELNKTTDIFNFGAERNRFFTNVDVVDPDVEYGVRYPVFKFFTDKLSNSEHLIREAREYLISCSVPYSANKSYYPTIINEDGDDPTFFVSTMREELYTPPALKS